MMKSNIAKNKLTLVMRDKQRLQALLLLIAGLNAEVKKNQQKSCELSSAKYRGCGANARCSAMMLC